MQFEAAIKETDVASHGGVEAPQRTINPTC